MFLLKSTKSTGIPHPITVFFIWFTFISLKIAFPMLVKANSLEAPISSKTLCDCLIGLEYSVPNQGLQSSKRSKEDLVRRPSETTLNGLFPGDSHPASVPLEVLGPCIWWKVTRKMPKIPGWLESSSHLESGSCLHSCLLVCFSRRF